MFDDKAVKTIPFMLLLVSFGLSARVTGREQYVPDDWPKFSGGKILGMEVPKYPRELSQSKISGEVLLSVDFDKDGHVTAVQVRRSDHPAFSKSSKIAARGWKLSPVIVNAGDNTQRPSERSGRYFVVHFDGNTRKTSVLPK